MSRVRELLTGPWRRLLGLVLLAYVLTSLDWDRFRELARPPSAGDVVLASLLLLAMHALKGLRWHWIGVYGGFARSPVASYLMYVSSLFLGYLTPGRLGELVKVAYARAQGADLEEGIAATFVDRVLDLAVTLLFAAGWLVIVAAGVSGRAGVPSVFVALAVAACLGWSLGVRLLDGILGTRAISAAARRFDPAGGFSLPGLRERLRAVSVGRFCALMAASVPIWGVYYGAVYVLARSAGLPFTPLEVVGYGAVGSLAALVPVTVAGLGTREGALVLLANARGASPESAVALSAVMLGIYALSTILTVHGWLLWGTARSAD